MLKLLWKRLTCKHKNLLATSEDFNLWGSEHITYVCMDCGKRFY